MSAYSDYVLSLNPVAYWRLNEVSGPNMLDLSGNIAPGTYNGSPTFGVPGATGDGDTAVTFPGPSNNYAETPTDAQLSAATQFSVNVWFNSPDDDFTGVWTWYIDSNNLVRLRMGTTGRLYFNVETAGNNWSEYVSGFDWTSFKCAGVTFDAGTVAFYIDGVVQATTVIGTPNTVLPTGTGIHYIATFNNATPTEDFNGTIDDLALFDTALTPAQMAQLASTTPPVPQNSVLPMSLSGFLSSGQSVLPTRLVGRAASPAASLPMRLESVAPGAFTGAVVSFTALVVLDGTDISAQLSGPINITHEESASGLADFVIIPPAGPIDLNAYERKPVQISFVSSGIAVRRFTGVTASANYDPDSGLMTIDCTTDLQGQLEQMDREAIDNLIGGLWSEWVFDDTADGWQYARDQLSTIQSEIHADVFGNLIVSPWKTKAVPDITLTDSERFSDSLTIERANLRDLLTRVRVNFDFRFTRLRHREVEVQWIAERTFCDWANNNWLLAAKEMVRNAADGAQWTRLNEISFDDLPPADPSICNPPRAWIGGAEAFCLGARWRAGRRFAQTNTDEFAMDVVSPDLEEAIGQQQINSDYSVEATYDATDYEAQKDFTGPPADFVFSTKSYDWQKDADENEADGRAAMETAQTVAMEVAKSEILDRARSNRVGVSHIYDPMMSLAWTVRINTPYCKATGKVALIEETINPVTGDLGMAIELAVSRHNGTGLGAEDPLTPPDAPEQPQETNTGRIYKIGYHVGQEEFSPPDDPDWDGWITNVQTNGDSYFPSGETYDVRFVVAYPEVETEARNELTAGDITTYNIIVPQDELEISN